jgi:hypothetical protein
MTIFTNKTGEKKEESDIPSPEVVSEYKLLVEANKTDVKPPTVAVRQLPPLPNVVHRVGVIGMVSPRHQHPLLRLCAVLLALVLLIILVFIATLVYRTWQSQVCCTWPSQQLRETCGVHYIDNSPMASHASLPQTGEFQQEVMIEDFNHERIEVPVIGDMRHSTILHDFNQNVTAIIDREQQYCFLLPLNRTLVMPPKDFWDLLLKLKSGYYIPDVDVIRENYRALTPPIDDISIYGYSVLNECRLFRTYKLVRDDEPIAMSKRSAPFCEFAGENWCLGNAGTSKMLCISIKGCL